MTKNISFSCVVVLLLMVIDLLSTMDTFASASVEGPSNKNIAMEVDIESFESAYTYAKILFDDNSIAFNKLKDWILSEQCQAYYKTGPYPEEVRKSVYWTETRTRWEENAELYRSEPVFEDFDVFFTTYRACDILALNKNYEINLYENPAAIVSFRILSEQYEYEDASAPPPADYQEKLVMIDYTGTETYEAVGENDYTEVLGDGWHLVMRGYDEKVISTLVGDVNRDGTFGVSDVILLQKWLLSVPDTYLANWKAADFYEDGKLDVFDLCLMKRALIEGFKTDSVYTLTINGYKITESESRWMGEDYSSSITRNEIAQYPEIVSSLKKVSAKVTTLKDTKMLSWGFEISDYGEDNLYLSCNDGTGKENDILLCKIGSKCAWLDDSDVQEFVTLLVESGLFSDKSIIQNYLKTK